MPSMYESIEKEVDITVEKARMNGYWFRHKSFGSWITPEEFEMMAKVTRIEYGENNRSMLDNYGMYDPRSEIRGRIAEATKLTAELQAFSDRVFAYFNQVPKVKK